MSLDSEFVECFLTIKNCFDEEPKARCTQVLEYGKRYKVYEDREMGMRIHAQEALELLLTQIKSKWGHETKDPRVYTEPRAKTYELKRRSMGISKAIKYNNLSYKGTLTLFLRHRAGITGSIILTRSTLTDIKLDLGVREDGDILDHPLTVYTTSSGIVAISPHYVAWNSTMSSSSKE